MGSVIGYESINGNIASFETDVAEKIKNLKINIEPMQDLHGYGNPWPAGGGKNKLVAYDLTMLKARNTTGTWSGNIYIVNNMVFTFTFGSDGLLQTVTANGTASADTTLNMNMGMSLPAGNYVLSGCPSGGGSSTYRMRLGDANDGYLKNDTGSGASFTLATDSSITVKIVISSGTQINKAFYPMILSSSETNTSYVPYSNVCPINGWTGVKVQRMGINVWDEEWEIGDISQYTGENINSNSVIRAKNYSLIKPNTQYYYHVGSNNGKNCRPRFYDAKRNFILNNGTFQNNAIFTTPENARYYRFSMQTDYGTVYKYDISINYPPTDTEYHAYNGETYYISFPAEAGEVYGGTLDVITGELVVDRMIEVLDGSVVGSISELPTGQQGTTRLYKVNESYFLLKVEDYSKNYITNLFGTDTTRFNTDRIGSYVYNKTLRFRLPESIADTPETVQAWLANNPLQIVYPLDEPITYQLTPLEIQTIIGTNNIYANTGDTSVIYPKTITPIETVSNVNLMELRRNIIAAQANDNLYDKWIWQQNKNDLIVRNNTAGFLEGVGNNIYLDQRENAENNRLNVSTKRGKVPLVLYNSTEGGSSTPVKLYPIPIPANANNVQISSDVEDGEYGTVVVRLVNGAYKRMKLNPSWIKNNPKLYFVTGKNHYLVPYIRRAANADFITLPQNVQLTFSHDGQWRWTLTEENLVLWKRNSYWDNTNSKICFYSSTNVNNYLTICAFDGFCGYWFFDQPESMHNHAPIPIPPTATKVTITTTPSLQAHLILLKCFDNQTQQLISDNGWKSTPVTMTFNADDNLELAVTLRVNSSASNFTDSTTPTEIIVQFE